MKEVQNGNTQKDIWPNIKNQSVKNINKITNKKLTIFKRGRYCRINEISDNQTSGSNKTGSREFESKIIQDFKTPQLAVNEHLQRSEYLSEDEANEQVADGKENELKQHDVISRLSSETIKLNYTTEEYENIPDDKKSQTIILTENEYDEEEMSSLYSKTEEYEENTTLEDSEEAVGSITQCSFEDIFDEDVEQSFEEDNVHSSEEEEVHSCKEKKVHTECKEQNEKPMNDLQQKKPCRIGESITGLVLQEECLKIYEEKPNEIPIYDPTTEAACNGISNIINQRILDYKCGTYRQPKPHKPSQKCNVTQRINTNVCALFNLKPKNQEHHLINSKFIRKGSATLDLSKHDSSHIHKHASCVNYDEYQTMNEAPHHGRHICNFPYETNDVYYCHKVQRSKQGSNICEIHLVNHNDEDPQQKQKFPGCQSETKPKDVTLCNDKCNRKCRVFDPIIESKRLVPNYENQRLKFNRTEVQSSDKLNHYPSNVGSEVNKHECKPTHVIEFSLDQNRVSLIPKKINSNTLNSFIYNKETSGCVKEQMNLGSQKEKRINNQTCNSTNVISRGSSKYYKPGEISKFIKQDQYYDGTSFRRLTGGSCKHYGPDKISERIKQQRRDRVQDQFTHICTLSKYKSRKHYGNKIEEDSSEIQARRQPCTCSKSERLQTCMHDNQLQRRSICNSRYENTSEKAREDVCEMLKPPTDSIEVCDCCYCSRSKSFYQTDPVCEPVCEPPCPLVCASTSYHMPPECETQFEQDDDEAKKMYGKDSEEALDAVPQPIEGSSHELALYELTSHDLLSHELPSYEFEEISYGESDITQKPGSISKLSFYDVICEGNVYEGEECSRNAASDITLVQNEEFRTEKASDSVGKKDSDSEVKSEQIESEASSIKSRKSSQFTGDKFPPRRVKERKKVCQERKSESIKPKDKHDRIMEEEFNMQRMSETSRTCARFMAKMRRQICRAKCKGICKCQSTQRIKCDDISDASSKKILIKRHRDGFCVIAPADYGDTDSSVLDEIKYNRRSKSKKIQKIIDKAPGAEAVCDLNVYVDVDKFNAESALEASSLSAEQYKEEEQKSKILQTLQETSKQEFEDIEAEYVELQEANEEGSLEILTFNLLEGIHVEKEGKEEEGQYEQLGLTPQVLEEHVSEEHYGVYGNKTNYVETEESSDEDLMKSKKSVEFDADQLSQQIRYTQSYDAYRLRRISVDAMHARNRMSQRISRARKSLKSKQQADKISKESLKPSPSYDQYQRDRIAEKQLQDMELTPKSYYRKSENGKQQRRPFFHV